MAFRYVALIRIRFLIAFAGLAIACSGSRALPDDEPLTGSFDRPTAVLLAIPAAGGAGAFLDAERLEPIEGLSTPDLPALAEIWGVHGAGAILVGATADRRAVAIDLESGRTTEIGVDVVTGVLSSSGTAYAVSEGGEIAVLLRRERAEWQTRFVKAVQAVYAGAGGRLLGVTTDDRQLIVAQSEGPPSARPLPGHGLAVAPAGDLLAVADDSGIGFVDPTGGRAPSWVRVRGDEPRDLVFTPSGHRVYFTRAGAGIGIVDRYGLRELDGLPAPPGGTDLRMDPLGRWLLVRPARRDSIWVVDATARRFVGAVAGTWDATIPAVTPDGVLLVAQGSDVVALDPDGLSERARRELGDSHWVPTTYLPRRLPTIALANQSAASGDSTDGALYVQVASSHNPAWATDLARSLVQDARLPARVLEPEILGEGFRVVLGPYRTREEATAVGTRLGRPFWIFTRGEGAAEQ